MKNLDLQKLRLGYLESEMLPSDFSRDRIVPDFAFNVLNFSGAIYRPVADEDFLAKGGRAPTWPEGRKFAVCLTHDVDAVRRGGLRSFARRRRFQIENSERKLKKLAGVLGLGTDFLSLMLNQEKFNSTWDFDKWLEVENNFQARSTFFFWPGWRAIGERHHTDCTYDMEDAVIFAGEKCSVAEMIRRIHLRSWEIGLHPSWYSYDNADEIKKQKEALEVVVGHEIVSIRQHYLHYDVRFTPRVQSEAGLKYDSSVGFNDNVGFRFGTCYPWHPYDLKNEEKLPILEIPLIIQDGAMLDRAKGMRLDGRTAFDYVRMLIEAVENVGGVLNLLWHPHYLDYPEWWALYGKTLEALSRKGAWFATQKEVGMWWEMQEDNGSGE